MGTDTPIAVEHAPNRPQVSIGMPVCNGEPFIREALDSLLAQTFTDFELIISDNASTDGTGVICQEYAAKDARIRYVRQSVNLGATGNFRYVLDEANGEYFMWAAADDVLGPEFIHELLRVLLCNPHVVCAMSDVENINANGDFMFLSELADIRIGMVVENWKKVRVRFFRNPTSNIFFCIYGLHKKNSLIKCDINYGGLVKYATASEIPFLAQLSLVGQICSIPLPLKKYRRHSVSEYQREQLAFGFKRRLDGFFNTSCILCRIAFKSSESFFEKLRLLAVISVTGARYLVSLSLRAFISQIRKR